MPHAACKKSCKYASRGAQMYRLYVWLTRERYLSSPLSMAVKEYEYLPTENLVESYDFFVRMCGVKVA